MNVIFRPVAPLVGAHFLICSRSPNPYAWLAAGMGVFIPLAAWAQASGHDPLDAHTATPPPVYESAFSGYKPYQDPELMPWKMANDVVREFGGMTAMKGMGEGDSSAHDAHQAGGNGQSEQPAQPAHDGSDAPPVSPAAPPKNKPADMKTMPGHDMSKMPQKAPAATPKPAAPAMPSSMPGHGGMHH